jgi:bifunctional non-homologous end joining protein LigD
MLQRTLPAGFISPCLPTKTDKLPSGDLWLHEIKHDGFRVIARKDGDRVRLYSRPGNDMTRRFPLIAEALTGLRSRSCIIDGEAVACDDNGLASFERIRYRQHDGGVFLYAFDLIELNGDDLRRDPLQVRKATLASIVARARPGIRFNEHIEGDGPTVFAHACKMGLEGIVSKRKDSPYRSGRSLDWLKMKNPTAPAVKREEEEDWGKKRWHECGSPERPGPHHDLRPQERRHLYHRVSDGRRRVVGDQRAGWRDPGAQAFPGADALRTGRAGCERNLIKEVGRPY